MKRSAVTMTILFCATAVLASTDDVLAKGKTYRVTSCAQSAQQSKCLTCINQENIWIEGQGCLDQVCMNGTDAYEGGHTMYSGGHWWMCDGLTGNWVQVALSTPPPPKKRPRPIPKPDPTAPAKPRSIWP